MKNVEPKSNINIVYYQSPVGTLKEPKAESLCTIYRHAKIFIDHYLQPLNDHLKKENKKVFLEDFKL